MSPETKNYEIKLFIILNVFISVTGKLHSVDQFLNIKLTEISISDSEKYPYMVII